MTELKDRYRQQRFPAPLAAELEHEFARRAGARSLAKPGRWQVAAAAAMSVILTVAAFWTMSPQTSSDGDAEQYVLLEDPSMRLSPAALTARTSAFGQLSVSRLSLPSNTNLAGVTSMPVLPPAPPPPATL